MNKLLPTISELNPITVERDAFYDGPFKNEFYKLNILEKLQILNDIVKQTMIYNDTPNPKDDIKTLIGDSYTACQVSSKYLESFNLNIKIYIKFAYINICENEENAKPKPVLIIEHENEKYLFDATPAIGYKAGKVEKISNQYQEYIDITGYIKTTYELLRKAKYIIANALFSLTDITQILELCNYAKSIPIFKSIVEEIEKMIKEKTNKPKIVTNNVNYDRIVIISRIKEWREELGYLLKKDENYPRQIELSQLITYYFELINNKKPKQILLDDGYYEVGKLTPRILYEKGFEYITIKPSGYIVDAARYIETSFSSEIFGVNYNKFGVKTELGLEPMKIFHPSGYKYIREMTGPTKNFFIRKSIQETLSTKKMLRNEIRKKIDLNDIIWYDGKPIEWNPISLNFVHSSDDPVDACMGYMSTMPEYQIMSRFNYPNPVLRKEREYE